jgi:hypothetical protein
VTVHHFEWCPCVCGLSISVMVHAYWGIFFCWSFYIVPKYSAPQGNEIMIIIIKIIFFSHNCKIKCCDSVWQYTNWNDWSPSSSHDSDSPTYKCDALFTVFLNLNLPSKIHFLLVFAHNLGRYRSRKKDSDFNRPEIVENRILKFMKLTPKYPWNSNLTGYRHFLGPFFIGSWRQLHQKPEAITTVHCGNNRDSRIFGQITA